MEIEISLLTVLHVFDSWQRESNLRPSAGEILNELEALWHGCCHNLVFDTDADRTETNADSSKYFQFVCF